MYSIQNICRIVNGSLLQQAADMPIVHLVHDSRTITFGASSLFFALKTVHRDGHLFIQDAYKKGVRNFIVSEQVDTASLADCNIIMVLDVLEALQNLAAFHRGQFSIPVIGITGSNGKTIVKEWLYQLLQNDYTIVRSPKSFNSQIGVPLSVWQMAREHTLAIFEAGISQPGEMERLQKIIQPTIGIFTNIGAAHGENFTSQEQKVAEKAQLFKEAETIIYGKDDAVASFLEAHFGADQKTGKQKSPFLFSWGSHEQATLNITTIEKKKKGTRIKAVCEGKEHTITIPFTDGASVHNAITCWCVLLLFGYDAAAINGRVIHLHPMDMRLQLKSGINHCTIINDSYSADVTSLQIALHFLKQQKAQRAYTAILSDFVQSEKGDAELYQDIAQALQQNNVQKIICIGEKINHYLPQFLSPSITFQSYTTTEEFIRSFRSSTFQRETILIKGARKFGFERIAQLFEEKVHQTQLSINLNAIIHNLKQYRRLLKPQTKVMAMVKAFAYGSGGAEIAGMLQYHNTDYLGVAYTDEGVDLRQAGITLPVMVMNTDATA
ncbi:MAG: UDP-N-acetylmuramoyl-tripeptide--D-alanyl-D-alanine ligase, partial [Flavisolibacter sp.]|nr:UDP-N-acetylmuramoyl-tripeptide--D-alanyl-D-alanine ligase [Flavisolibacter sp.]